MSFTGDKFDKACGFLLINDLNVFLYCCKTCPDEFGSSADLETHILSEHRNEQKDIERVFISENDCEWTLKTEKLEINATIAGVSNEETNHQLNLICDGIPVPEGNISTTEAETAKRTSRKKESKVIDTMEIDKKPEINTVETSSNVQKSENRDQEVFYCEMCPETTLSTFKILKVHMKRHRNNPISKTCPICKKKPKNFDKHMKLIHLEDRPYKCEYCTAKFRTKNVCINHMRGHTREKPFLCESCGKTFASQSLKIRHEKQVHTRERPHSCTQCDRKFLLPYHLREHISAFHTPEKSYTCDICDSKHSTRNNLWQHKLIHGEKTKKCRFCEKMFKTAKSRRIHEKQVHKIFRVEQEYRRLAQVNVKKTIADPTV